MGSQGWGGTTNDTQKNWNDKWIGGPSTTGLEWTQGKDPTNGSGEPDPTDTGPPPTLVAGRCGTPSSLRSQGATPVEAPAEAQ